MRSYRDILRTADDPSGGLFAEMYKAARLPEVSVEPWDGLAADVQYDPGSLAAFGPGGIRLAEGGPRDAQSRLVPLGSADLAVFLAVRRACACEQDVVIETPPSAPLLGLTLAVKLQIGGMLDQMCIPFITEAGAKSAPDFTGGRGVLLVSRSIAMRDRYGRLMVGSEPLWRKFPGYRMRPDGSTVRVSHDPTAGVRIERGEAPLCFFLADRRELPEEVDFRPAVILLDFLGGRWDLRADQLVQWARRVAACETKNSGRECHVVALAPTDSGAAAAARAANFTPLCLDAAAIAALDVGAASVAPSSTLKGLSLAVFGRSSLGGDRTWEVRQVLGSEALAQRLAAVRAHLAAHEGQEGRALARARQAHALLQQMAPPLPWYETAARGRRVRVLIDSLGWLAAQARAVGEEGPGGIVAETLRAELDGAYALLRSGSPKADALQACLREIPELTQPREPVARVTIAVRDRAMARAVHLWLLSDRATGESPTGSVASVEVLPFADLACDETRDVLITCGAWPARWRWQLGAPLARRVIALVYPDEVRTLARQRARAESPAFARARHEEVVRSLAALGVASAGGDGLDAPESGADVEERTDYADFGWHAPADWPPARLDDHVEENSWDDEDPLRWYGPAPKVGTDSLAGGWESFDADDDDPDEGADDDLLATEGDSGEELVSCVTLRLAAISDEARAAWMYLDTSGQSEVLRPDRHYEDFELVNNHEMEPGMVLVTSHSGRRQDLFERLREVARSTPEMQPLLAMQRAWDDGVVLCSQAYQDERGRVHYAELTAALREAGATVAELTIRSWVERTTMAARASESIRAVGAVSGHPLLQTGARDVERALEALRAVHRGLGRRLSAAIRRNTAVAVAAQSTGVAGRNGSSVAQEDFSTALPMDELADALELWRIESVETERTVTVHPRHIARRLTSPL